MPVGVASLITPFNFPLNLVLHKIAPALAAGCPFILKPAPATPLSALALGGCVTINIYFPAAAAEKAADKIIDEVWQIKKGEDAAKGGKPAATQ